MKLLVLATTPGPTQSLLNVVRKAADRFQATFVTSRNRSQGGGDVICSREGCAYELLEDLLPDYVPLHVTSAQCERLICSLEPDVVLTGAVRAPTGESRPIEDMICATARAKGIPSYQFIEGWEVWYPRAWSQRVADRYLVIDQSAADLMHSYGMAEEVVTVVGYPRSLFSPATIDQDSRERVRAKLRIAPRQRLIACFGQVTTDEATTLPWVAKAAGPDTVVIFQAHPRDTRPVAELIKDCPPGSITTSSMPSDLLFHGIDCCVTHYSLTSFTAAYLGVPTILTLLPEDVPRVRSRLGVYPSTAMGGTVEVYDADSAADALARMQPPSMDFRRSVQNSIESSTDRILASLWSATACRMER